MSFHWVKDVFFLGLELLVNSIPLFEVVNVHQEKFLFGAKRAWHDLLRGVRLRRRLGERRAAWLVISHENFLIGGLAEGLLSLDCNDGRKNLHAFGFFKPGGRGEIRTIGVQGLCVFLFFFIDPGRVTGVLRVELGCSHVSFIFWVNTVIKTAIVWVTRVVAAFSLGQNSAM